MSKKKPAPVPDELKDFETAPLARPKSDRPTAKKKGSVPESMKDCET